MTILAIDPDMKACGVAIFDSSGELCVARASSIDELQQWLPIMSGSPLAVIEMPRTYGGRASRGDANDLIELARIVGRAQQIMLDCNVRVELVSPSDWKGTVDKDVMLARAWSTLTDTEKEYVHVSAQSKLKLNRGAPIGKSSSADVLDAVGLGLWRIGRVNKKLIRRS